MSAESADSRSSPESPDSEKSFRKSFGTYWAQQRELAKERFEAQQAAKAVEKEAQRDAKTAEKARQEALKRVKFEVRDYKNGKEFEKDAQKRIREGWLIRREMNTTQSVGLFKAEMFGFGARQQNRITVNWVKGTPQDLEAAGLHPAS
jgi:hypothetical protein